MAKVKNKRENHTTKRGTYGYGYGPKDSRDAGRGRTSHGAKHDSGGRKAYAEKNNRQGGFCAEDRSRRYAEFDPATVQADAEKDRMRECRRETAILLLEEIR